MTKHEFLLKYYINDVKDDDTISLILLNLDLDLIITDKDFYVDVNIKHKPSNTYIFEGRYYTENSFLYEDDMDTRLLYQSYKSGIIEVILSIAKFNSIHKTHK